MQTELQYPYDTRPIKPQHLHFTHKITLITTNIYINLYITNQITNK